MFNANAINTAAINTAKPKEMTLAERVMAIAQGAVKAEMLTHYPAEIVGAQAALESGWLEHSIENNCFGWKEYPGCYGRALRQTSECFSPAGLKDFLDRGDGREVVRVMTDSDRIVRGLGKSPKGYEWYIVRDWFATFPSLGLAFEVHARKLQQGKYAAGWKQFLRQVFTTHESGIVFLAESLQAAGYATVRDERGNLIYAQRLLTVALGTRLTSALRAERGKHLPSSIT